MHLLQDINTQSTKTITSLQKENKELQKQLNHLQKQNSKKPKPYIEDISNLQQNINNTCISILKDITIPLIARTFIHKQTITNENAMTYRITETAKDLITNQTNIQINPEDINIIDITNS